MAEPAADIHGFFGFVAPAEGLAAVLPLPRAVLEAPGRPLAEAARARAQARGGGEAMAADLLVAHAFLAARDRGGEARRDLTVCAAALAVLTGRRYFTMVAAAADGPAIDSELAAHAADDRAAGLRAVRAEVARRAGLPLRRVRLGMLGGAAD